MSASGLFGNRRGVLVAYLFIYGSLLSNAGVVYGLWVFIALFGCLVSILKLLGSLGTVGIVPSIMPNTDKFSIGFSPNRAASEERNAFRPDGLCLAKDKRKWRSMGVLCSKREHMVKRWRYAPHSLLTQFRYLKRNKSDVTFPFFHLFRAIILIIKERLRNGEQSSAKPNTQPLTCEAKTTKHHTFTFFMFSCFDRVKWYYESFFSPASANKRGT